MPINIKNEQVTKLALELAQLTGESITDAVGKALEEKLTLVQKRKSRVGLAKKLDELSIRFAENAPPEWFDFDIDAELYNEMGLPRDDR